MFGAVFFSNILIDVIQEGCEVFFKIKYHTPLKRLIDAYCKKQGINPLTVRFSYDGELISGDKTAEQMGMEDQDVIDCHQQQTGGFSFN